jgi:hypothetical protein
MKRTAAFLLLLGGCDAYREDYADRLAAELHNAVPVGMVLDSLTINPTDKAALVAALEAQ